MKKSKLLIPTLTCLSIAPAIATLTCCNQTNVEQDILDSILNPADIKETVKVTDFVQAYKDMTETEKKNELLYDAFGLFNLQIGTHATENFNIHNLYVKDNEGGFKINVTKYNVEKNGENYYASLLGYVSYVFAKQHIATFTDAEGQSIKYTFNANDYIMFTFDFSEVKVNPVIFNNKCGFKLDPTYGTCLGFCKLRFDSGKHEALKEYKNIDTTTWSVSNSKNWTETK